MEGIFTWSVSGLTSPGFRRLGSIHWVCTLAEHSCRVSSAAVHQENPVLVRAAREEAHQQGLNRQKAQATPNGHLGWRTLKVTGGKAAFLCISSQCLGKIFRKSKNSFFKPISVWRLSAHYFFLPQISILCFRRRIWFSKIYNPCQLLLFTKRHSLFDFLGAIMLFFIFKKTDQNSKELPNI